MSRTVLAGARIFDGTIVADGDVAIEGDRIAGVGVGLDGDRCIDMTGKGLLPGFIDCHVHLLLSAAPRKERRDAPVSYVLARAVRNLDKTLAAGITTVRDAAGADRGLKRALAENIIRGPRVQIAVSMVSQTGGHGEEPLYRGAPRAIVDGPIEARRVTRELIRDGADWIKVATTDGFFSESPHLREDELAEIAAEAHAGGVPVMAHAHACVGVKSAVRAGFRSIEHGLFLDDEAIQLMLDRDVWLVPTLLVPVWLRDNGRDHPKLDLDDTVASHTNSFQKAISAGVKIAMGTDCGVIPHGINLRELELMVERGLEPLDALAAATSNAADLLGLGDEIGRIEPGKRADIVVVEGDPLDVLGLSSRINAVYQGGDVVVERSGTQDARSVRAPSIR